MKKGINIDALNIGLMFISLMLAVAIPIELLILSYAFIGPMHYLTEINWLENKGYFIKGKKWAWILVALTAVMISAPTAKELTTHGYLSIETFDKVFSFIQSNFPTFLFVALLFSLILVFFHKTNHILIGIFLVGVFMFIIYQPDKPYLVNAPNFIYIFGIFLPTVIHVYLFTGLFMLYGALKSKSTLGVISFFILALMPVIIYNIDMTNPAYTVSEYFNRGLRDSNFMGLNQYFANFFGVSGNELITLDGYSNTINGVSSQTQVATIHWQTQVFIAFAYIYHYLNWFSKTTVIKWHRNLSPKRFSVIVVVYLMAIGLYIYNYKVGFIAMFFLSFLHVLLEFPLNIVSIKGIGEELSKRLSPKSS